MKTGPRLHCNPSEINNITGAPGLRTMASRPNKSSGRGLPKDDDYDDDNDDEDLRPWDEARALGIFCLTPPGVFFNLF